MFCVAGYTGSHPLGNTDTLKSYLTALNLNLFLYFSYPVDTNGWGSGSHSATSVIKVNIIRVQIRGS